MKVAIAGSGVFGSFLHDILSPISTITADADIVILAVPFDAYQEVAFHHRGKHLVNVCSVQDETNRICLAHSGRVTGIHPMFGCRSPAEGRTSIVTHACAESAQVLELFAKLGKLVTHAHGIPIDGVLHDQMMAKTHLQVVRIAEDIKRLVDQASGVPEDCLPTSFKRLIAMGESFLDMPKGTLDSILANKQKV